MKYFLNKEQSYELDKFAINELAIPSQVLMENAAHSTFNIINNILKSRNVKNIVVLCGSGNNGGDGFAIARYLCDEYNVSIYFNGNVSKMSPETLVNYNICKNLKIPFIKDITDVVDSEPDLIIESLIGIGADENLNDKLSKFLEQINKIKSLKIAIDSPAGLNINTGIAHLNSFKTDYTITMFSEKLGLFINDGLNISGKVIKANLGFPSSFIPQFSNIKSFELDDIEFLRQVRDLNSSKFDFGRICIIAGSKDMLGAGALAANAAISAGAGLVHLVSTDRHSALLPEVICHTFPQNDFGTLSLKYLNEILEITAKSDVIAIGPGLSNYSDVLNLAIKIIEANENKKIIIDADALKCVDENSELTSNFILTPHLGEFSNITKLDRTKIAQNRIDIVKKWAKKLNCNIVLKGYPTIISDKTETILNLTGNPALASAGSGDVLTGILAAIYALFDNPIEASAIATYIHGDIADKFIQKYSKSGLTASKIINELKKYEI